MIMDGFKGKIQKTVVNKELKIVVGGWTLIKYYAIVLSK